MRSASSRISTVEFAIGVGDAGFQQLRGAADAGQRVLHLVRQDRRHAGDAARGAAERELPVERARRRGDPAAPAARRPGSSGSGEPCTVMPRLCSRGLSSSGRGRRRWPRPARTWSISRNSGLSRRHQVRQARSARVGAVEMPRNCSAAWLAKRKRLSASSSTTGTGKRRQQRRRHRATRGAPRARRGCAHRRRRRSCGLRLHAASASQRARARPRGMSAAPVDQRVVEGVDQREHRPARRQAVHRGAELGRAGQAARVPGEMLAGEPQAGVVPKWLSIAVVMRAARCAFCRPAAVRAGAPPVRR